MFFKGLTWFRGHELHFAQVRVKGSCQTEIPNWRYKWTVDNTDIGCVFIRFDSPSSSLSPSLFLSLCSYGSLKGWTLPNCKWLADWRKRNQACDYLPKPRPLRMRVHTHVRTHTHPHRSSLDISKGWRFVICYTDISSPSVAWLDHNQSLFICVLYRQEEFMH